MDFLIEGLQQEATASKVVPYLPLWSAMNDISDACFSPESRPYNPAFTYVVPSVPYIA
ncbi:hypothetical protein WJ0W_006356 [Paenibacillus melissococcoides]|uniref:Uncharacterized protein n=1 Tax=Paenibacillus melissococcoides TaxID=2912268 RepID=A0ABM9GAR0_9BACL|nr:hypothetical protein WJ0W_006356 [Paenibacillus melissococcoides]